jgi:hypothetical protein
MTDAPLGTVLRQLRRMAGTPADEEAAFVALREAAPPAR